MNKYFKPGDQVQGYFIDKRLGEGRYGIAYLAHDKNSQKYIIKQLKEEMLEETREKLFYEEQLLKRLDNPKFPKFIGKFHTRTREGYILEYKEGKVFEDLLVKDGYEFTKAEIYDIASKILDMMETLHENHIVHRDIRPPNVIINEHNELFLIDFGLARSIDGKRYSPKMDYWYLGDFLIHLYYSSCYEDSEDNNEEKPWYEELSLNKQEVLFLKKLMGVEGTYHSIKSIRKDLNALKTMG